MAQPAPTRSAAPISPSGGELPWLGLFHLSIVYIVWGSTYLAIRIAVHSGSGFPPFSMAAARTCAGGLLLFLWAWARRKSFRITLDQFWILTSSGLLLWIGGNGLVTWAEQRADSGYAALIIGSTPIWAALIESVLDKRMPSVLFVISLLAGFGGVALLSWPTIQSGDSADIASLIALLSAPFFWSCGSTIQRRRPVAISPMVSSGVQQLVGCAGFLILVGLTGEPRPSPTPSALAGWAYLVVFGSVLAFTSYVLALRLLPIRIVMTYAYVNPVIALGLGWLILDEPITWITLAGAGLVMVGVAGIFRDRFAVARST